MRPARSFCGPVGILFLKCSGSLLGSGAVEWGGAVMFRAAMISRFLISLVIFSLVIFVGVFAGTASAQDRRQNAPGEFDFYLLSLSWSPSFCEQASERGSGGRSQIQCGGRPYYFVVHGLWPQYEH